MIRHKHFPTFIYIGILCVTLVLFFNFADIFESYGKLKGINGRVISQETKDTLFYAGLTENTSENIDLNNNYSKLSYYMYNSFIVFLFIMIGLLVIRFINKVKN